MAVKALGKTVSLTDKDIFSIFRSWTARVVPHESSRATPSTLTPAPPGATTEYGEAAAGHPAAVFKYFLRLRLEKYPFEESRAAGKLGTDWREVFLTTVKQDPSLERSCASEKDISPTFIGRHKNPVV